MTDSHWRILAVAMGAILLMMMTYFINSNAAQWQAIGCLKEKVAKIEGKLEAMDGQR